MPLQAKHDGYVLSGVWQYFSNGQWHTGMNTHNHRENTEGAGYQTRDLYTKA